MGIYAQPAGTAYRAGPEIQYTADGFSDILSNLSTVSGCYVVDLSDRKIYVVQSNGTIVYTKLQVDLNFQFAVVPSLSVVPAGTSLEVPAGYNLLVAPDLGLDVQGDVKLDGDIVDIPLPTGVPIVQDSVIQAVAAVNMPAGTPVYIDPITGYFNPADAVAFTTSRVIGILTSNVVATFVGTADTERVSLSDWTAIIGTTSFSRGVFYYLAVGGGMSTTAPSGSGQVVVKLGTSVTTQTISLNIQYSILL